MSNYSELRARMLEAHARRRAEYVSFAREIYVALIRAGRHVGIAAAAFDLANEFNEELKCRIQEQSNKEPYS